MEDHRRFLIEYDEHAVADLVRSARRVAVIGIKPETRAMKPAHYVPAYLAAAGLEVIPVPVYYPEVTHIFGRPVYRRVADVPGPPGSIDIVDVFRSSHQVADHLEDLLAARPRTVWLQLGIRDDAVAEMLARAGIFVVQDRCLMVAHQRYAGSC